MWTFALTLFAFLVPQAESVSPPSAPFSDAAAEDAARIEAALTAYDQGLADGDVDRVLSVLGDSLIMFNGAFSDDPRAWEAHLYLDSARLRPWLINFVGNVGPHRNRVAVRAMNVRGDAAVVTTVNTGSNRFRSWTDEEVVWLAGRRGGDWKLLGFFIRNIRNPQ